MTIHVFDCPACGAHWWEWRKEDSKGHDCPKGYPAGGVYLGKWEKRPNLERVA